MPDESQENTERGGGEAGASPYVVLARKYRPSRFADLIGQDALVRTLSNAIQAARVPQAIILTGVRGVGKTTTARIIARMLNCVGADGQGGPTVEPCDVCDPCRAISEDRHVDVLEMDAASRTGVDGIRDLIDGVRYLPVSARFKVYIIDEVHMLSTSAFNALLKTLEEPPPHAKFIFATTEVRKVPVTVLSRCQRFDLRRVPVAELEAHFRDISEREGATVEPAALGLIARAAEGSVRDGLSLLDQAIAHGSGTVGLEQVRDMLGLADRSRIFELFDKLMAGDIASALGGLRDQYNAGADPAVVLQDLLEVTHWLTRLKATPGIADDTGLPEDERERGLEMAEKLAMPVLARTWQMLLKGLQETRTAPSPLAAAEMVLVRLAYAADLPSPADLVRKMERQGDRPSPPPAPPPSQPPNDPGPQAALVNSQSMAAPAPEPAPAPDPEPRAQAAVPLPGSFADTAELLASHGEMILHAALKNDVHLVRFEPGRIEFRPGDHARPDLAGKLAEALGTITGSRWVVAISREAGEPTLRQQADAKRADMFAEAADHPQVKAVLDAFPGAEIVDVRPAGGDNEKDGT